MGVVASGQIVKVKFSGWLDIKSVKKGGDSRITRGIVATFIKMGKTQENSTSGLCGLEF